ncbi:hypothetical protein HPB49_020136 [Dermacentor silvarum]|uniref:Uncharacterized protein n=1 Tax=Dermacentor silvarum TaxID=543639 RepID=A0ACB8DKJ9_DERSI|nr:hypothetical protein HPB49_020136 [Dermacentor silvarum]
MDNQTNWAEVRAVPEFAAAHVKTFINECLVFQHGIRGITAFMSRAFKDFLSKHGIRHAAASPQHPQTTGQNKRTTRTIKDTISSYVCPTHGNWDDYGAAAVFALKTSQHEVTRTTPFELLYGRSPRLPQQHLLGFDTTLQERPARVDSSETLRQVLGALRRSLRAMFMTFPTIQLVPQRASSRKGRALSERTRIDENLPASSACYTTSKHKAKFRTRFGMNINKQE